jgi:hypothetical protein
MTAYGQADGEPICPDCHQPADHPPGSCVCPICDGTGTDWTDNDICALCAGTGHILEEI